jgi:molybdate transport system substrate-binding protein
MTALRLLSGGAAQGLVAALRPAFEADTGWRIDGTFGAVGAMRARLVDGAPADVMILTRALIAELARDGRVMANSAADIGAVETAIAVRQGDAAPTIADAGSLRATLLAAGSIHFPDPQQATAGIHFAEVLRRLGIWDALTDRLRPAPNGAAAMRALAAAREARPIGCTQATEIRAAPGVALVAPLPEGCALATTYTAAVTTTSEAPDAAARLIALLAGDSGRDARKSAGFV